MNSGWSSIAEIKYIVVNFFIVQYYIINQNYNNINSFTYSCYVKLMLWDWKYLRTNGLTASGLQLYQHRE